MELSVRDVLRYRDGFIRWNESGEITLADLRKNKRVNLLLNYLYLTPASELFNSNFNGLSFKEVIQSLGIEISIQRQQLKTEEFVFIPITTHEQAMQYHNLAPEWSILNGKEMWEEYSQGNWRCIFILNRNAVNISKTVRPGFPFDAYGVSLMCFASYCDGGAEELISRWNGYEDFETNWESVLESVLGDRLHELREFANKQFER